jgi:hypothetical protein
MAARRWESSGQTAVRQFFLLRAGLFMQLTARPRVMTFPARDTKRAQGQWDQQVESDPGVGAAGRILGAIVNRAINKRKPVNRMFEPGFLGGHGAYSNRSR